MPRIISRRTPQGDVVHPIETQNLKIGITDSRDLARRRLNRRMVSQHRKEELPPINLDTGYKTDGKYK